MNQLVKQLQPVVKALSPLRPRRRTVNRRRRFRRPGVPRIIREAGPWGRALPASYSSHVKAAWHVKNMTQTTMHVSGCDLVTPLPGTIASIDGTDMFLFSVIPSNPAYWSGTRIGQVAPAYMNYRPLRMVFHYIPQVAVTQPGTVIMGTLWNGASPSEDLQQTLVTSNGGVMINCYVPGCTQIQLAGNLQQNLFTLPGDLNPDTNSFLFVAVARGCTSTTGTSQVVPGYFFVEYEYVFKNPIGQAWDYIRSSPVPANQVTFGLPNRSIVLLEQDGNYGPGTILDVEVQGGVVKPMYHGSDVTLSPTTLVQAFENGQNNSSASIQISDLTITQIGYAADSTATGLPAMTYIPLSDMLVAPANQAITVEAGDTIVTLNSDGDTTTTAVKVAPSQTTITRPTTTYYKILSGVQKFVGLINKFKGLVAAAYDANTTDTNAGYLTTSNDFLKFALPSSEIVLP